MMKVHEYERLFKLKKYAHNVPQGSRMLTTIYDPSYFISNLRPLVNPKRASESQTKVPLTLSTFKRNV